MIEVEVKAKINSFDEMRERLNEIREMFRQKLNIKVL